MSVDADAARQCAERALDSSVRPGVDEEVIIRDAATEETAHEWIFFYNTRIYIETGAVTHALAGNGPIIVEKASGAVRFAGSSSSWRDELRA